MQRGVLLTSMMEEQKRIAGLKRNIAEAAEELDMREARLWRLEVLYKAIDNYTPRPERAAALRAVAEWFDGGEWQGMARNLVALDAYLGLALGTIEAWVRAGRSVYVRQTLNGVAAQFERAALAGAA